MTENILLYWTDALHLQGDMPRSEYFKRVIPNLLVSTIIPLVILIIGLFGVNENHLTTFVAWVILVMLLVNIPSLVTHSVRRIRSSVGTAWAALTIFVPYIGILAFIFLLLMPERNK